jgi:hypothetical protein
MPFIEKKIIEYLGLCRDIYRAFLEGDKYYFLKYFYLKIY